MEENINLEKNTDLAGRWDLEPIYPGFNSLQYKDELKLLNRSAERLEECVRQSSFEPISYIKRYLRAEEDFRILYSRLYAYASSRYHVNVTDKEALDQVFGLETVEGSLAFSRTQFAKFLRGTPDLDRLCKEDGYIGSCGYYLKKLQEEGGHLLAPKEEEILSMLALTGSKAWGRLQSRLSAGGAPAMRPETEDADELERSFLAELEGYRGYADLSAAALSSIKGEVLAVSGLRGFSSPFHRSLTAFHMDPEILNSLLESVEEYLPRLRRYYKLKARVMKYPMGLPFYLREVPMLKEDQIYDYHEAKQLILNAFASYGSKMYRFGKEAFDGSWIDYLPEKNKASGASCDGIYAVGESRIRLHYKGTLADVNTLAHELGHGYHNRQLFEEGILNYSYDLPIAETASKFSEILFKETLKKQLPQDKSLYVKDFIVSGFVNTIVDIQSRFYFEDDLFKLRATTEPGARELCELMTDAQIRCYGNALDKQLLNPYMWLNKPHYYFADRSYYNFPYSFGTLLSIAMYRSYEADPWKFAKDYDVFLSSTGKMNVYDLCKIMGFDVKDKKFFRDALEYVAGLIEELEGDLRCFSKI